MRIIGKYINEVQYKRNETIPFVTMREKNGRFTKKEIKGDIAVMV